MRRPHLWVEGHADWESPDGDFLAHCTCPDVHGGPTTPRPTCGVVVGDGVEAARFAGGTRVLSWHADQPLQTVHGHDAEPTLVSLPPLK